jgi:hypothetical protein
VPVDELDRGTPFCSEIARSVGESLVGSAPKDARHVVAIAYDGVWARDPLPTSSLSEAAKAALGALVEAVPRTRIVFVRRAGHESPPTVIVASARSVLRFELGSYDEIPSLDLAQVLVSGEHPRATPITKPVVFVCAHGKRDRCCALRGMPIYAALRDDARVETWLTSHLGGHRFAPILLSLPDGHSYGRLEVAEVRPFVDALVAGRFHDLARLRGRAGLDEPVQAAEALLRAREGYVGHEDVHVIESQKEEGAVRVLLATPKGEVTVRVRKRPLADPRPSSCGDEPSAAFVYELA